MTETNLYKRIGGVLNRHGTCLRIENVSGASVPDIAWLTHGTTVWIEAKIRVGHRIMFNKFQIALARKALEYLPDWQWICAVQNTNLVGIYKFTQFWKHPMTTARSSNIVTINIATLEPWCELHELPSLVMTQLHIIPAVKAELRVDGHGK